MKKLFCILLAAFIAFSGCDKKEDDIFLQEGTVVPDFTLPDLSGKIINFRKDFGKRKNYLIFWSSSCVSCKEGMAILEEAYKKNREDGFSILAINVYQKEKEVAKFVDDLGLTYPVLLDKSGETATAYNVFAVPVIYVVDSNGVLLSKHLGELTKEEVEKTINSYWY